jgi:hypothetical protein
VPGQVFPSAIAIDDASVYWVAAEGDSGVRNVIRKFTPK